jgi:hypothetical protein
VPKWVLVSFGKGLIPSAADARQKQCQNHSLSLLRVHHGKSANPEALDWVGKDFDQAQARMDAAN